MMTPTLFGQDYQNSLDMALARLTQLATQNRRLLLGLTGAPGSGKSTFATLLQTQGQALGLNLVCLSMDGFHFSKAQLAARPDAEAARRRRGAPWTFDAQGFIARVQQLKKTYHLQDVYWPDFQHDVGDPVEDAVCIAQQRQIIVVEGLYLLHQQDGWQAAAALFDQHWFLDVPTEVAIERLAQRHQQAWGFSHQQAMLRIQENDGLNAQLVAACREHADWRIRL